MALQVFTDGTDTVIAFSADDARAVLRELGATFEDDEENEFEWIEEDKIVTVHDSDGDLRRRGIATTTHPISGLEVVARTCAEWIASEGRGMLCSTEY